MHARTSTDTKRNDNYLQNHEATLISLLIDCFRRRKDRSCEFARTETHIASTRTRRNEIHPDISQATSNSPLTPWLSRRNDGRFQFQPSCCTYVRLYPTLLPFSLQFAFKSLWDMGTLLQKVKKHTATRHEAMQKTVMKHTAIRHVACAAMCTASVYIAPATHHTHNRVLGNFVDRDIAKNATRVHA